MWWFAIAITTTVQNTPVNQIGPFHDQEQCLAVRMQLKRAFADDPYEKPLAAPLIETACWDDQSSRMTGTNKALRQ